MHRHMMSCSGSQWESWPPGVRLLNLKGHDSCLDTFSFPVSTDSLWFNNLCNVSVYINIYSVADVLLINWIIELDVISLDSGSSVRFAAVVSLFSWLVMVVRHSLCLSFCSSVSLSLRFDIAYIPLRYHFLTLHSCVVINMLILWHSIWHGIAVLWSLWYGISVLSSWSYVGWNCMVRESPYTVSFWGCGNGPPKHTWPCSWEQDLYTL